MYNICVDFRHKIFPRPQKTPFVQEPCDTLLDFYAVLHMYFLMFQGEA